MNREKSAHNWQALATTSHYQTALAVKAELLEGNVEEAIDGVEELLEALSRSDRHALRSQLIRLMAHIIKWYSQPERRSRSWIVTIENARLEIEELTELEPSLKPLLPNLLSELFPKAKRMAEKEMGITTVLASLSWSAVFDDEYDLA